MSPKRGEWVWHRQIGFGKLTRSWGTVDVALGSTSKEDLIGIDFGVRGVHFRIVLEEVVLRIRITVWHGW